MENLRRESRLIDGIGPWLEWRRGNINASQIGALHDVHPFLSREQLAGELRGQSTKGDTHRMKLGRIFEPAVLEYVRTEHPTWHVEKATQYFWLPDNRIGCTPDAFFSENGVDDGLVECKTVSPQAFDQWRGRPPTQYLLQTLTGLLVTGRTRGLLAVMVMAPPFAFYEFAVERHPAAEKRILEAVSAWWEAWEKGKIAAPAPVEELEAMLDDGSVLDWSGNEEIRLLLEQRRELKASLSAATEQLGRIEYQIKNHIGPASSAWLPGWQIEFRRRQRKEYTVAAAEIRTLRIKETAVD